MLRLTRHIHYPKLLTLLACIVAAYILFQTDFFLAISQAFNSSGYSTILLAGFLFAYGFTAPFAVGLFASVASEVNIFTAALLAGGGALVADLIIFQFIKTSFADEFDHLRLTRLFQRIRDILDHNFGDTLKKYLLWTVAGFLIASPLPDEFGVTMISGFTTINKRIFSVLSYALNTLGILAILAIAKMSAGV
ncbi:hypothetical protein HZA86_05075 [Candidatus Uhrbacteria bacterium]|nr:hypothetical protein [Candidatus Uhrbacteria bacterium]